MKITAIKTHKITKKDTDITQILKRYIPKLKERSVVAVTSKIVAICEGAIVPIKNTPKDSLVESEADYYLPKGANQYGFHITIKNNTIIASAGIDESNGNGFYIFWPKNPSHSANKIRGFLQKHHKRKHVGVIIVDSKTVPLRWGTVGTTIGFSGFQALNNYVGTKDLFNYSMRVTRASIMEGLGAAAVLAMGEGAESTPLAVIEDIPFVKFKKENPTKKELAGLNISMEEDVFSPILTKVKWLSRKK